MEPQRTESDHQQAIQLRAYHLWQQRGCPFGSPEVDWFGAEQELANGDNDTITKPAMVAAAEVVGSALGSLAAIVTSAISRIGSEENANSEQPSSHDAI